MPNLALPRLGRPGIMEPPDKRRRMEAESRSTAVSGNDEMWDEDFDNILTQDNLNLIDDIIASQSAPKNPRGKQDTMSFGNGSSTLDDTCFIVPELPVIVNAFTANNSDAKLSKQHQKENTPANAERQDGFCQRGGENCNILAPRSSYSGLNHEDDDDEYRKLKSRLQKAEEELSRMKDTHLSKDGQIHVLRDRLARAEADQSAARHEISRYMDQTARQKSARELELDKSLESLRAQLQFKDKELLDVESRLKQMERQQQQQQQQQLMGQGKTTPIKTSPHSSPISASRMRNSPGRVGNTGVSEFPTVDSFTAGRIGLSPAKKQTKSNVQMSDQGIQADVSQKSAYRMKLGSSHRPTAVLTINELSDRLLKQTLTRANCDTAGLSAGLNSSRTQASAAGVDKCEEKNSLVRSISGLHDHSQSLSSTTTTQSRLQNQTFLSARSVGIRHQALPLDKSNIQSSQNQTFPLIGKQVNDKGPVEDIFIADLIKTLENSKSSNQCTSRSDSNTNRLSKYLYDTISVVGLLGCNDTGLLDIIRVVDQELSLSVGELMKLLAEGCCVTSCSPNSCKAPRGGECKNFSKSPGGVGRKNSSPRVDSSQREATTMQECWCCAGDVWRRCARVLRSLLYLVSGSQIVRMAILFGSSKSVEESDMLKIKQDSDNLIQTNTVLDNLKLLLNCDRLRQQQENESLYDVIRPCIEVLTVLAQYTSTQHIFRLQPVLQKDWLLDCVTYNSISAHLTLFHSTIQLLTAAVHSIDMSRFLCTGLGECVLQRIYDSILDNAVLNSLSSRLCSLIIRLIAGAVAAQNSSEGVSVGVRATLCSCATRVVPCVVRLMSHACDHYSTLTSHNVRDVHNAREADYWMIVMREGVSLLCVLSHLDSSLYAAHYSFVRHSYVSLVKSLLELFNSSTLSCHIRQHEVSDLQSIAPSCLLISVQDDSPSTQHSYGSSSMEHKS